MTAGDLLVLDDLMLLLTDDDGASVQGAGTLHYTLGGALLAELALLGRVETDGTGIVNGPRVTPVGGGQLPDPLLQSAFDTVAEKTRRVQPLLRALGLDVWRVVRDRLVVRGLLSASGAMPSPASAAALDAPDGDAGHQRLDRQQVSAR